MLGPFWGPPSAKPGRNTGSVLRPLLQENAFFLVRRGPPRGSLKQPFIFPSEINISKNICAVVGLTKAKIVLREVGEVEGVEGAIGVGDAEDRAQRQTQLAATEPSLDFKVEDRKITVQYQNLDACTLNYYLMDIELLFSRNPFVQEVSGQFAIIRPNESRTVELPKGRNAVTFDLPEQYRDSNVMIEIGAGGITKAQAYYPHSLDIRLLSNYGQVRLAHATTRAPLPKVYIKVYARTQDGEIRFYKDGYTDLRGRFDYTSLNTNEIENVERFAILILSEKHGAAIRETAPPKM